MQNDTRAFLIDDIQLRANTMQASISSEMPVERQGGFEVLSHAEGAIDLSRAPLPLIANHDNSRLNIGLVENLKIVGKKLRGIIRFGDRAEARDIWKDVRNGILKYLSVGYKILEREDTKDGYIATKWQPFEVSIVSTPADVSVGFNRSRSKRGNMEYTKQHLQELLKQMQTADGAELSRLGSEYDRVATVVDPDAPLVRDSGAAAVLRWSKLSTGADKTPIDTFDVRDKPKFETFGDMLLAVREAGRPGGQIDNRLHEIRAATGLGESIPSEGGFLVESQTASQLMEAVFETSPILKLCTKFNLTGSANSLKVNGVDETSRVTGSRAGGIQAYWLEEAGEKTASKPSFRQIEMKPKKLIGLCYATDELLEDATALDGFLTRAFRREFDWMITDAIVNGSGAGQPLGIMTGPSTISIAKEAGQTADTIVYENVNKMWSRLLVSDPDSVVWLVNRDCLTQLNQMSIGVGLAGQPVFMPPGGVSAPPFSSLFGAPVVPCESCATLGDTGDIILADMSGYYIAQKGTMKKDISIHVRYIYDESCYRFVLRLDGQPMLGSAITPANGTDTLAHFVKLNERT